MNDGFRIADAGVIAAIIVNIIVGTWEVAHLDGRIGAVERDQTRDEVSMDALARANAEKDIHFTKVDSAIEDIRSNIDTILGSLQRIEQNVASYPVPEAKDKQPNFTSPHR